jgi:polysaccharide biosynthesis transport protein
VNTSSTLPPPSPGTNPAGALAKGQTPGNPANVATFGVRDALHLGIKHAFWIVLFAALGPIVAGAYTSRQVKIYEAHTSLIFDFSAKHTLGKHVESFDAYSDYLNKQEMMATEFNILRSMKVARAVVEDAGLRNDKGFMSYSFPGADPQKVEINQIAAVLSSRIRVESVKNTHVVIVSYEDNDPARAQRLVSTIVDTYIRIGDEDARGTSGAALAWLTEQLERLERELETSEQAVHDFKQKRNLVSVSYGDQSNMLREEIGALNQAVTAASIRKAQLDARSAALEKIENATPEQIPAAEFLDDTTLQEIRKAYIESKSQRKELTALGKLEDHPEVKSATSRMQSALSAFRDHIRNRKRAASRESRVAGSEIGRLSGLLQSAKARALDLNLLEIKYRQLHRKASTNEKLYRDILERLKEVDLSRMLIGKHIKVLDPPRKPGSPIRPKMATSLGIGAFLGLFLGLAIAVLRELSDRTIKTPNDLETKIGITSLGFLPIITSENSPQKAGKRRRGKVILDNLSPELTVHRDPTSNMAESARSIRSNLLFMSPDNPPKVMLITSSGPSEGKTTTAVSLATTFAQAGSKVLLVDLDLRRPRLHQIFRLSSEKGVTTALLGEPVEETLSETPVPNLFVLPSGPIPPNPAELLLSEKLEKLLEGLRGKFDRIIIDSPPINAVTDATILSTLVDGTIFVARSNATTLDQIRHAFRNLTSVRTRILGAVLNAVNMDKLEYKYAYQYYYYSEYRQPPNSKSGGNGKGDSTSTPTIPA